jgi:uncharacterized protein
MTLLNAIARLKPTRKDDPDHQEESASQLEAPISNSYQEPPEPSSEPLPEASPRRIPNLGHALLFIAFAGLVLIIFEIILMALGKSPVDPKGATLTVQHPKLQLAAMAATYVVTIAVAWLFYPVVWHRRFLDGLSWQWPTARRQVPKLIGIGLLLGGVVQVLTYFISTPKTLPIDDFFLTQWDAWLLTIFGTIVAPIFEEVCFRGFLMPSFAIAYDWISMPRTPESRLRWQTTTSLTPAALIFSAILSSIFFALMHAQQVAHIGAILGVLFSVSLVLTFIRVKTQSVAASAMVHGAYNFFVFLTLMIATGGYRHLDRMTK